MARSRYHRLRKSFTPSSPWALFRPKRSPPQALSLRHTPPPHPGGRAWARPVHGRRRTPSITQDGTSEATHARAQPKAAHRNNCRKQGCQFEAHCTLFWAWIDRNRMERWTRTCHGRPQSSGTTHAPIHAPRTVACDTHVQTAWAGFLRLARM